MEHLNNVHPFDAADDELELRLLESLSDDPDYWDELDRLESEYGACREWDHAVSVEG